MRMVGAGMTAAVLLAGLAASAASAQDTDGDLHSAPPKQKMWWDGWFTPAAKPPEKKHDDAEPAAHGPSPVELAAASRQRERAALDRRWEVCDRLMEIAVRTSDDAMQAQVEQLHDKAWDVYQERIAALSAPDSAAAPPEEKPKFGKPSHSLEGKP